MFSSLTDPIKITVSIILGIAVGVLVYEGIKLPWIGQVVPGIVYYRVDAATSKMVTTFERDVFIAQRDQERRYREIAEAASARAQERAAATEIARQNAEARIDELQAQAKKEGMDGWSKDELDWLQRH
jgi:hypothetical protein